MTTRWVPKVGDRVRFIAERFIWRRRADRTGTIVDVEIEGNGYAYADGSRVVRTGTVVDARRVRKDHRIKVHRDGLKKPELLFLDWLEPIPLSEWSLDETCRSLAYAVLAGDTTAALALADRIMELQAG